MYGYGNIARSAGRTVLMEERSSTVGAGIEGYAGDLLAAFLDASETCMFRSG